MITETWLDEGEENMFNLRDYKSFNSIRKQQRGGGVAIYVRNVYSCKEVTTIQDTHEIQVVEIKMNNKTYNFVIIYNPNKPNAINMMESLSQVLESLGSSNIVLIGDLNIDINEKSDLTDNYIDFIQSYGLILNNKLPTREASDHGLKSLIDHVITSPNITCNISNINDTISDHNILLIEPNIIAPKKEIILTKTKINYVRANERFQKNKFTV